MAKKTQTEDSTPKVDTSAADLVAALVQAIQLTRPVEKKNANTRKPASPWDPTDGTKKLKMKRKMYQHGIAIDPDFVTNEEIELLNKLKIGRFLNGWVKVYRRKDHGIDIDYPVKTASQRMKLVSEHGVRNLAGLLQMCIDEAARPVNLNKVDGDED